MKNEGSPQVVAFALRTPYLSGSRGGTRGRRQRFPSNERRDLEGAHRKAGAERTGGGEYSGAGAGGARARGLGVNGARAAGRSRARPRGPGFGAAGAAAPRRPSASVGGRAPRRWRGPRWSRREFAGRGSGPRAVASWCDPYSLSSFGLQRKAYFVCKIR